MLKIGIIGLGLIGGSLARSIKSKLNPSFILAADPNEISLKLALNDKSIDKYTLEIDENFRGLDIVFVCTQIDKIFTCAEKLSRVVTKNTIITDVGSTKNSVCNELKNLDINFIGGHPMAGSEKIGYESSTDFLFENAYYLLTPNTTTNPKSLKLLKDIVEQIGGIPVVLKPADHDRIVAAISHTPHVIAAALVNLVKKSDDIDKNMSNLAAGGFKDITRIASSSPEIWENICLDNKTEIKKLLSLFKNELDLFEKELDNSSVYNFFDSAKNYRDSFSSSKKSAYRNTYELRVDVVDKPGSIATVATMLSVNQINITNIGIIHNREFEQGVMSIVFSNREDMQKSEKLLANLNYTVYT